MFAAATALLSVVVTFSEPGFPLVDVSGPLIDLRPYAAELVDCGSIAELERELRPGRLLVWRHGSGFPAEAWPELVAFLEAGGHLVVLGGEGFTHVVTGTPGAIRRAADDWGVKYARVETTSTAGYTMSHTAELYLIDADGNLLLAYPFGTPAAEIVEDLRALDAA